MPPDHIHLTRIQRYATIGERVATVALCLLLAVLAYLFFLLVTGAPVVSNELISDLEIANHVGSLSYGQTWLGAAFWSLVDLLGVALFITVRKLFKGLREDGVFVTETAERLRRIGFIVLAMGPVSILSNLFAGLFLVLWVKGDAINITISVEDADVYGIVLGLVIIAVSQIMIEGTRIADENRAFV